MNKEEIIKLIEERMTSYADSLLNKNLHLVFTPNYNDAVLRYKIGYDTLHNLLSEIKENEQS